MDDLLAYTYVPQGGLGALDAEVHAFAFFADEGLEGCWHPAPGAEEMPYTGQRLEARPAEQVARGELIELELLLLFARESERSGRVSMTPSNATDSDAITFLMGPPSSVGVRVVWSQHTPRV